MRYVAIFGLSLAVVGCTHSETIILRNPSSGQITRCKHNTGLSFAPVAQTMINNSVARSCAASHKAAGWQRMN